MRNYFWWAFFLTTCWWIVLIPIQYDILTFLYQPFRALIYTGVNVFFDGLTFQSDSVGMYLLVICSVILGFLSAIIPSVIKRFKNLTVPYLINQVMLYFLILNLLDYGCFKIFDLQFYTPESNTLHTELGYLSKDILYWSLMGSSRSFVLFMGIIELIAAFLIVIPRTRFLGLLVALGVFTQVVMVNISFDISVKLLSITLLLMVVFLLTNYSNEWRLLLQLPVKLKSQHKNNPIIGWKRGVYALMISLCVVEAIYPFIHAEDDTSKLLFQSDLQGGYLVHQPALFKRIFVHKQGYIIVEQHDGRMIDYKIKTSFINGFTVINERTGNTSRLTFKRFSNHFNLTWEANSKTFLVKIQPIPVSNLSLLENSFHWFSDDFH